ncbi:conserved hypothetical protein [Leptospira interrogans serovar Manilae]|uniref:Tail fiber protein n=1 Tax=Leptospira interrogans serovar Manilae TaxID=214675 RepID=A0AAQ1SQH4_LEPIR|nr:hypothetical protein [Leptospira interrogans]AKP25949.1 hypothetical protein LIMLP_08340 [Leptospira interrogans serovar Manilae]AKP29734.1 hypothetical protein LIMHP_08335 [Leptospira interrogans serovar Manilae]EYU62497.1 hypothetical protein CI00_20145 [Leptospira interrogans serovar Manilae]SOR63388.1 conserved hypothetical protein [Leptospira interrogans serovar Manilae]
MAWSETEPGQWSSDSGLLLENRPGVGPYVYSEELEDEIPDSGMPLVDLFQNPLLSVATVDPDTGKLPVSLMPSITITDLFIVNNQVAMLSLSAQRGDIAVRTDIPGPGMFILSGDDPTFLANWIPITAQFPDWNHIQNKPTSFPPSGHNHDTDYYTKFETDSALLQKRNIGSIFADEVLENQNKRFVTQLEKDLLNNPPAQDWDAIQNKPTSFPPSGHNHNTDYYTKSESDSALLQKRNVSTQVPATEIFEDSAHRFVTDAEKAAWNAIGGGFSIPLGGILEDSLDQLPSSNFKETNGQAISRSTFATLWNVVRRNVTSIAPATDRINVAAHGLSEGQLIKFAFTGGGITALTNYYVRNPTLNDFQISTSTTGGVINLTSSQTGELVINVEYGFGNGSTTFNVPDRRGIFPRSAGVHGSRAKTSGGNYDGGSVGFAGQDRAISHRHQQYAGDVAGGSYGSGGRYADSGGASAATILYTGSPVSDGTGNPRNGNEVAPAWTAVKYKLRVL